MPDNPKNHCFIDTNIWLYAFIEDSKDAQKSAKARELIRSSTPVVSTQVINEVCVNLLRQAKFREEQISRLIASFYATYPVIGLSLDILLKASQLRKRYSLSFWDSIIVASAIFARASVLYSEDMQHNLLIEEQLRIVNPFIQNKAH